MAIVELTECSQTIIDCYDNDIVLGDDVADVTISAADSIRSAVNVDHDGEKRSRGVGDLFEEISDHSSRTVVAIEQYLQTSKCRLLIGMIRLENNTLDFE